MFLKQMNSCIFAFEQLIILAKSYKDSEYSISAGSIESSHPWCTDLLNPTKIKGKLDEKNTP